MAKQETFQLNKKLNHLAFIMDGNGRWAKKRLLPRSLGHKAGVKRIKEIVDLCFFTYNIQVVSLYCFSSENWNRPQKEIDYLFNLLKLFFNDNIEDFKKRKVRITISGDLLDTRIPNDLLEVINKAIEETKDLQDHTFNVLFNYGGDKELVYAFKSMYKDLQENKLDIDSIDTNTISSYLYQKDLPKVDLLVRTSGEQRLSNCLMYETNYAEFIFTKTYWPDFDGEELLNCLKEYNARSRRFGGLKNE